MEHVRLATTTDLPRCQQLYQAFGAELGLATTVEAFTEIWATEKIFVITQADETCGFLSLYQPDAFVHCLYVVPHARHCGFAKALLQASRAVTDKALSLKCLVTNQAALAYYQQLGFESIATGGQGRDAYVHLCQKECRENE